jgi:hypothetical protein
MRYAVVAVAVISALVGLPAAIVKSSAMPLQTLAAARQTTTDLKDVRFFCDAYRCWWRPSFHWRHGPYWGTYYWSYQR